MNRREMILRTAAATIGMALSGYDAEATTSKNKSKKVLYFTKSSGFEHSVIKRDGDQPSFSEKILADLGPKHGIDFTFSKDGSLFSPAYLATFDAYCFYTTGDLTTAGKDKNPPMTPAGKQALLDAIHGGKGFIGLHCATDTFHSPTPASQNSGDKTDPYIRMLGGEFIMHDQQQVSKMHVVDPKFPGQSDDDFSLLEEWYSLKNFSDDLHVLLVQETEGMTGLHYQRPPYPATWARRHGSGRVFYTSMGHREDVWQNSLFQGILFGGIAWAVGNTKAKIKPNIRNAAPGAMTLPPEK